MKAVRLCACMKVAHAQAQGGLRVVLMRLCYISCVHSAYLSTTVPPYKVSWLPSASLECRRYAGAMVAAWRCGCVALWLRCVEALLGWGFAALIMSTVDVFLSYVVREP
jgi:hypothetical protein